MPTGLGNAPLPISDPIARQPEQDPFDPDKPDTRAGLLTDTWIDYLTRLVSQVTASWFRRNSVRLTGQTASISATDLTGGGFSAGIYRVDYYARITRAATTSSSLTVTFDWTEGGQALALSGAAITGNAVTSIQSSGAVIEVDSNTPIRYSTTYASVGATTMQYRLTVVLTQIQG